MGPMRQEPTRAGRKRQQRREVTLGKLLWRDETLAGQRRREVTLAGHLTMNQGTPWAMVGPGSQ